MSFISRLHNLVEEIRTCPSAVRASRRPSPDRWRSIIEQLKGRAGAAGSEWLTARDVYDALGLPLELRPGAARSVAALMKKAGWTPALVGPRHYRQRGYIRLA